MPYRVLLTIILTTGIALSFISCAISKDLVDEFCPATQPNSKKAVSCGSSAASSKLNKFLLYSVNYGEGFNLRRDVYIRFATLIHILNERRKKFNEEWILVLPPWHNIYHWFNSRADPPTAWSQFFDLKSLNRYIPVVELEQYINDVGSQVDNVYILQHYAEGWGQHWEEKYEERPCIEKHEFRHIESSYEVAVAGRLLRAGKVQCVSVQGTATTLLPLLSSTMLSTYIARGETIMHEKFGELEYWRARRSMRFAAHLVEAAQQYRHAVLNSTDDADGVTVFPDWTLQKRAPRAPTGGPYLGVHWRRQDYLRARPGQVPTVQHTARQLRRLLRTLAISHLYLATDATEEEVEELRGLLKPAELHRYSDAALPDVQQQPLSDGSLAIIDQIIASHAMYFIGSHESTFSFRIQEEREIMGFPPDSTFNRLCGSEEKCEQPARWTIVY
ncbi:GDP-fucose protein O-fucosyltransferase [Trinorchestia longiramus]|nr:GDP-fucose protein O-fucosyltransferase [Trinorchestia longiramus]